MLALFPDGRDAGPGCQMFLHALTLGPILGRGELLEVHAKSLILGVTDDLGKALITLQELAVECDKKRFNCGLLECRPIALFAVSKFRQHQPVFRYVLQVGRLV